MATKMSKTLSGSGRMGSRIYPTEPTPLHFTQLHYPSPSMLPPPATQKPSRRSSKSRSSLCCCCCSLIASLCSLAVTLLFLLGIAALITWLVLRPIHTPNYSLEALEVRSFNVSGANVLNADFVFQIRAENPNRKIEVKYGGVDLEASYAGQVFGRSAVAAFAQGHRNVTTVASRMVVDGFVFPGGSALAADSEKGRVALQVRGRSRVRVKVGAITSFAVRVRMECNVVMQPRTRTVISKTCRRV